MKTAERAKEFNKENYKPIKVYIRKDKYPTVENRANELGMKVSGYVKNLIDKDLQCSTNDAGGGAT